MPILSVQSHVAYGRVGNRAAVPALERLEHDVWPVSSVSFSHHPAYGGHTGEAHRASELAALIDGIERRGALPQCAAVLSGYLADAAQGRAVLDAVGRIRAANPQAVWALDPVIGDLPRGAYVPPDLVAFFRDEALPLADMVFPNVFELGVLSGRPVETVEDAASAAALLVARGPEMALVTGVRNGGAVSTLLVAEAQAWQVTTPWIEVASHGAGDLLSALFLGHLLLRGDARDALARAVHGVYAVLEKTKLLGLDYLALVQAQDEFVASATSVTALPLSVSEVR